ncbi:MAG: hypothetical protein WBL52_04855 [Bacillota bacterium]|jgi:rod shape-determining protein MreD|nr:hypothetical protein [Bacillota bacterium]HOP70085.1 hypothetical protein [Bacillota bacterium]HPT35428.1 hypothetical protein [Bacillota bacterium]HPZ84842.1 hypothetical protein [Bacillota bacterium]HQD85398.1 hypothetical protein [Bacillota bacterium]
MNGKRLSFFIAYALLTPLMLLAQYVYLGSTTGLDLGAVLACSAGWLVPVPASWLAGFGIGLIQDVFVGRTLGFCALSLSLVAMVTSWVRRFLNPRMPFAASIAAMVSTGIGDCVSYAVLRLSKTQLAWEFFLRGILPYSLIWAFALIIPVNLMVNGLSGIIAMIWPDNREKGSV